MTSISLIALFIYVLGAFAYGSALLLSVRQAFPVWSPPRPHGAAPSGTLERASLVLFGWSAAYFVVATLIEVRWLVGGSGFRVFDFAGLLLTYGFPPLIMHVVYDEVRRHAATGHRPVWRWLLAAMYLVAPLTGLALLGMLLGVIPRVAMLGAAIGWSIGALFTLCSAYCVVLMVQGRGARPGSAEHRSHNTMIALFGVMTVAILILTFMRDQELVLFAVERLVRTAPLAFLVAAIYFESPFVFYDLVVKRGAQLLASLLVVGGFLMAALPWLDQVPPGVSRPWLLALAAMPLAMFVPWMHTQVGRLLDLVWFGRAYTPAEAVRVVLASLQRATDERTLLTAAEAGFQDIFRVPVGLHTAAPPAHTRDLTFPVHGADDAPVLWITARHETGHLLSEDQALLRSLGTVVAYLLENLRLHERRKAQDQVEQALRLQTSRSELKALRAQINPHFLFNALNAIASLIHTDPARADSAVEQLAEVFRYTLRRSESEWAPLDQEIAFVQAYLDVEHARFGRRLTYTIEADPGGRGVQVPSMVLHTLVENAVKHGISAQRTPGHILVRTVIDRGRIRLEVHDTGPGPSPEGAAAGFRPDGERFGLRSIRDRLAGHFGDAATLTLTRDGGSATTVACVEMPAAAPAAASAAGARP
ncbi:MAG: histidine kinase [Vicinamibacterales bacterium]|nr:histidine kinase [Vicinamibacterales bacterium]